MNTNLKYLFTVSRTIEKKFFVSEKEFNPAPNGVGIFLFLFLPISNNQLEKFLQKS